MNAPMGPEDPNEKLWNDIVEAIHKPIPKGEKRLTRADLDAYVQEQTNGQLASFADLTQARQSQPQAQEGPGALASAVQAFGAGAGGLGTGLLPKAVGLFSPDTQKQMEDYAGAASESHPIASAAGSMAGGMAGGTLLGGPVGSALEGLIPSLAKLTPAMRAIILGPAVGGVMGFGQGIADQPGQEADVSKTGVSTALGAAGGLLGGALGEGITKAINPAAAMAHDLVRASAPIGKGILGGQSFKAGSRALEDFLETQKGLPEALQKPIAFASKAMRNQMMKLGQVSPQAADEVGTKLRTMIEGVEKAKDAISNHPTTGYNALLDAADPKLAADPRVAQLVKEFPGKSTLTGREIQEIKIDAAHSARVANLKYESGQDIKQVDKKAAQSLRDKAVAILNDIPGYQELNAKVSPYLKWQRDLQKMANTVERLRPRQVAMPGSKIEVEPAGAIKEGVKEQLVGTSALRRDKAGRTLAQGLMKHTPKEFLHATEFGKPWDLPASRGAGALTGLLGEPQGLGGWARKKIGGLLGE